jgi:endo-1,4-beta-D-glucanase Y
MDSCTTALERLTRFTDVLTQTIGEQDGRHIRVVLSHGGVAQGSVVSEGQGYGLLIAAATVAGLEVQDYRRDAALDLAFEYFLGWRQMMLNTGQVQAGQDTQWNVCQNSRGQPNNYLLWHCGNGTTFKCLPSWKWSDDLVEQFGFGSASDADADGILGAAPRARERHSPVNGSIAARACVVGTPC